MQVEEMLEGTRLILTVRGRIDSNTSPQFQARALSLMTDGVETLIVDMAGVVYVSSAGLRAFFATSKKLPGGRLRLAAVRRPVFEVFSIAGFDRIFTFCPDLDSAIELS